MGGSSSSCNSTWGGWAMGGCGSRGGWARAGDTAGGRAGLGGRAAARLLGLDGCWGSALCKARRTQQCGGEAPVVLSLASLLHPDLLPICQTLSPPSSGSHHLQNKDSCQEDLRDLAPTSIILSGGLCLPPPFLPPAGPCLQVSKQACPECPHLTFLSGISVCPHICNWELQRGHIFSPDNARSSTTDAESSI